MKSTVMIALGSALGGLAVILGAFGAHALESTLTANGRTATYETGSRYHLIHALALVVLGMLAHQFPQKNLAPAAWLWIVGMVLFSGSLYTLSITNQTILGAVAPLGGLGFILGWAWIAWQFIKG